MLKSYTCSVLFSMISLLAIAQTVPPIQWQKNFGGSQFESEAGDRAIKGTPDGGYILTGQSYSNDAEVTGNHGNGDYWIIKIDSSGNLMWQKCLGGSEFENSFSIELTSDNGYIIAGESFSNDGDVTGSHGSGDAWIVKLDSIGNIQWQKSLGGSNEDAALSITRADSGYIIAGASFSNDGDVTGNHGDADYWIVKLDASGNIVWQKSFGGSGFDLATAIQQTTDGDFIVSGYTSSDDGNVTGYHGSEDYWIIKLDSSGKLLWQKSLGGSNTEEAYSIERTSDGGYITAGFSSSNDGDVSGNHGDGDYWIVKLTSGGTIEWQKSLGGSNGEWAFSIKQTNDEGYITAGYSMSADGDVSFNHGDRDYWIVKLAGTGDIQWQKSFGGSTVDVAYSIEATTDHGYIIAGGSDSKNGDVSGNYGNSDFWIVKLAPDVLLPVELLNFSGEVNGKQNLLHWVTATENNNTGFEVQRCNDGNHFNKIGFVNSKAINGNSNLKLNYDFSDIGFAAPISYYRLKQIDKDGKFSYSNIVILKDINAIVHGSIAVYPNPVLSNATLQLTGNTSNISVSITDMSGKKLWQNSYSNKMRINLPVERYVAGNYFVTITNGKEITTLKLIKQ